MAAFYGLWTYLTHTVFNVSIVTVPVLVATFLASVPVAGQYLVALPAALELCVIGGLYKSFVRKRALVKYQYQSEVIKVMLYRFALEKIVKF